MSEEYNEEQEGSEEASEEQEESSEETSQEDQRYLDQKRRAEKAEEKLKHYEKQKKDETSFDDLISITHSVKDLSNDEVNELKTLSEELGVPEQKVLTSKAWKARLNEMRADAPDDIEPSQRTSGSSGTKSWNEMTKEERKANFANEVEKTRRGKNIE